MRTSILVVSLFAVGGCANVHQPAVPTGAVPQTPSRCERGEFVFCDGFEKGEVLKENWPEGGGPAFQVVADRTARGRFSLHVTSPPDEKLATVISHRASFAKFRDGFFVRMFVFPKDPLPQHNWNYLLLTGQGKSWRLGGHNEPFGDLGGVRVLRMMHHPGHRKLLSGERFPTGRWVCWEMEFRPRDRSVNVWMDGRMIPTLAVPGTSESVAAKMTWDFPSFERLQIGYQHAHTTPGPVEVWIDEVALDGQRIGCER